RGDTRHVPVRPLMARALTLGPAADQRPVRLLGSLHLPRPVPQQTLSAMTGPLAGHQRGFSASPTPSRLVLRTVPREMDPLAYRSLPRFIVGDEPDDLPRAVGLSFEHVDTAFLRNLGQSIRLGNRESPRQPDHCQIARNQTFLDGQG